MSSTISFIDTNFNHNNAKAFIKDVGANSYYLFTGRTSPSLSNDATPDDIPNSFNTELDAYRQMLFGKAITSNDVNIVTKRYDWTANTIYTKYDNGDPNLINEQFYVMVKESDTAYVYKCLDNNSNTPSTQQPTFSDTSASDISYQTSDGYTWKYLYTIDEQNYNKFVTLNYIPVIPDANVIGNSVPGAIDVIAVANSGSGYNNYSSGSFSASDIKVGGSDTTYNISNTSAPSTNNFFNGCTFLLSDGQYKTVTQYKVIGVSKLITIDSAFANTPDATVTWTLSPTVSIISPGNQIANAAAHASVNAISNTIYSVEMLDRGEGYYFATANVVAHPSVGVINVANVIPLIGPINGHGSNVEEELFSKYVEVSITFANTESNTIIANNDYRQVGIVKNPLFSNVSLTVYDTDGNAGSNGSFTIGEKVSQGNTIGYGTLIDITGNILTFSNVFSGFITGNTTYGVITGKNSNAYAVVNAVSFNGVTKNFLTYDACYRYIGADISGTFENDETLQIGNVAFSNAVLYDIANTEGVYTIRATEQYGTFFQNEAITGESSGATLAIETKYNPDIIFGSGEIFYLQNFNPIDRSANTSEQINLILEF